MQAKYELAVHRQEHDNHVTNKQKNVYLDTVVFVDILCIYFRFCEVYFVFIVVFFFHRISHTSSENVQFRTVFIWVKHTQRRIEQQ